MLLVAGFAARAPQLTARTLVGMAAGVTVARLRGMPIRLSVGLALGLVGLAIVAVQAPDTRRAALALAAVVASLLAHELGHGVAAQRHGYDVDRIELSMIGGRAVWSGGADPDDHAALVISAAGPGASAAVAVGFALVGQEMLAAMNLGAALINLLPIRGLDGWIVWRVVFRTSSAPEP